MANKHEESCFLCGKSKSQVNKLLKGVYGYACDECVNTAYELLQDEEEEEISHNVNGNSKTD